MRKSNYLIIGILVLASIFFLWLWYHLQFNLIDNPLDLVLTIIWWAVVAVGCVSIKKAEDKRQERVRTAFVAPAAIFNSEAGVVDTSAGTSAVDTLQGILEGLEYNFHLEDFPSEDQMKFDYIVRSKKFEVEKDEKDAGAEATADTADAASTTDLSAASAEQKLHEVKTWEGEVVSVAHPDDDPKEFTTREELAALLAA